MKHYEPILFLCAWGKFVPGENLRYSRFSDRLLEKKTGQLDVTLGGWLAKFDPEKPAEIQKLSNKWSSTRRESRPI